MSTVPEVKKKKSFKMPHMLFLMLGLILFMSLLTYIVPAGQFARDPETNALIGDQFVFDGKQTPISPWQASLRILQGMQNSSLVISLLLVGGGTVGVILETGALDETINYAVYKLKDQGVNVLVPLMFIAIGILGGFGGGDQMVAIVPVGVMFAKKLRLDPIVACAVTFMASMVGFSTGPTRLMTPQLMLDLPVYSGFGMRFWIMNIAILIGAAYTLWYARRIQKDPTKSFMGNTDWYDDFDSEADIEEVVLSPRAALVTALFFIQYFVIVYLMTIKGMTNAVMPAVQMGVCIVCGLLFKMNFDKLGNVFARGVAGMGFVCFVIGMAGCMSLVMNEGRILHTIVYFATQPLKGMPPGVIAIGISIIIMGINLFIPSASSKAAILIPIVRPMTEALGMPGQIAAQAFQVGDGFSNSITPALGWTSGSLQASKVEFPQWWKFSIPLVAILMVVSWVQLYFLGAIGWTGL